MAKHNGDTVDILVIDTSNLGKDTAKGLIDAVSRYRFVFVKNHGVDIPLPMSMACFGR